LLTNQIPAALEILPILLLNLLNGCFALSEIALVSVRRQRMAHLAEQGSKRARTVCELLAEPEKFLSAVQIGITLTGIISGVYGGATLTDDVRPVLERISWLRPYAPTLAYTAVVALVTYLSIVIGELIPKTFAIRFAEPVALAVGGLVRWFSRLATPFVWILTTSTTLVFKIFRIQPAAEEKITTEDLRYAIRTAGKQGLFGKEESDIQHKVLSFGHLRVRSIMTHRLDVEWVDVTKPIALLETQLRNSPRTRFPACEGTYDKVLGYLHARDFFACLHEPDFQLRNILREPVFVPENQYAIDVLPLFRKKRCYFGIVTDEFGAFEGVLTLHDISEALVGDLPDADEAADAIVRRTDGSLLVSGTVLASHLNHFLQQDLLPENNPFFSTVAGFVFHQLETMPAPGDGFDFQGFRFEVLDMDGASIDKVLLSSLPPPPEAPDS
jgi:putative hemolysin